MLYIVLGVISVTYLLNFSFGFAEILPDVLPVVGHIDEALAFYILLSVLEYFGISIPLIRK